MHWKMNCLLRMLKV